MNDAVFAPSEARIATAGGDALVKVCMMNPSFDFFFFLNELTPIFVVIF